MKNKFSTSITKALLVMSLASTSVFAIGSDFEHQQEHEKKRNKHAVMQSENGRHFMQHKFKKMANYLELTKEQRQQAKAIRLQGKESHLMVKESLQGFHQQSKALIMADSFDEQAFRDLQNQYQHNFTEMALIKAKNKHSFMQLLTAQQKEKMKSFKLDAQRMRKRS